MQTKNRKRLGELDAFRGVAAIVVVLFHCTMFRTQSQSGFFLGIAGVDFFFMISGFVIFMSLNKGQSGSRFVLSRFIRIFPNYWVIATFTFTMYYVLNYFNSPVPEISVPVKDYIVNLTMINYYFDVPNIDGSYWTLIIELLFYALIYVLHILRLMKRIIFIGLIICVFEFVYFSGVFLEYFTDYSKVLPLLYHFPLFFIGIVYYKIYNKKSMLIRYIPIIVLCLVLQLFLHSFGRATLFMSLNWYAVCLLFFNLLFLLFVMGRLSFLVNKFTKYLGDISYSLYLLHQPIVYVIIIPFMTDVKGVNFWISTLFVAVPVAVLLATIVTYKVEIPLRNYLRQKLM